MRVHLIPAKPLARVAIATSLVAAAAALPMVAQLLGSPEHLAASVTPAFAGDLIPLTTSMRISNRLPLSLDRGLISRSDRAGAIDGRAPAIVTVGDAALTLDLSPTASQTGGAAMPQDGQPSPVPLIAGFSSGAMRFKRGSLTVVGPTGVRSVIDDVNATVTVTRKGSYKLVGAGELGGQRLAIDAAWTDVAGRDTVLQLPLRVSLRSNVLQTTLDGLFTPGDRPSFSGQAEFKLGSLSRFVAWVGYGLGFGDHIKSIVVAGPLEWSASQMSFSRASIGIDGNLASGALTINHGGKRPSLDGTLAFEELDLERYLLHKPVPISAEAAVEHLLTSLDADLRLSAEKVRGPAFEMARGAITVSLNKGQLQAEIAELQIEGGKAGGQLAIDLNQASPICHIKMKLKSVDAGRVLAAPLRRNALLGRANLSFEGSGQGRSPMEALSSLTGRGQFDLAEPGRLGLDLPALVHAARSGGVVGWSAAGKGTTPVDTLIGRFRLIHGAITIETMTARSGTAVLSGSGRLDVPARLMEMSVSSGAVAVGDAPIVPDDVLTMRGTWDAPTITLVPRLKDAKAEAPLRAH